MLTRIQKGSIQEFVAFLHEEDVINAAVAAQGDNADLFQKLVGIALDRSPGMEVLCYVTDKLAGRYSAHEIASWESYGAKTTESAPVLPPKTEYVEILGYVRDALVELISPLT